MIKNKNMYPDVAADLPSSESLSFAGLVCSQEQNSTARSSEHLLQTTLTLHKQEPEFEFSCSVIEPTNNNKPPNHKGTVNGSHQSQVPAKKIDLEDLLSPPKPYRKKSLDKKKPSNHSGSCKKDSSEGKRRTERQGLGKKLFSSFASPCRDCRTDHVVKPTPHVVKQ